MGDLAKARVELEQLYLGIPDDSVNLTFQDLADMKQKASASDNKRSTSAMDPLQQDNTPTPKQLGSSLTKLPSLDFSRGLQGANHHHKHYVHDTDNFDSHMGMDHHRAWKDQTQRTGPRGHTEFRHGVSYDDVSVISMASNYPERGQRRRPGIPHSNICTICSTSIYIFRHRCLVCGRVYCRQCVCIGMGEMAEGRKCVLCLGRRFSPRYIKRAGKMGCCWRYPSIVKQAELKWAEKGPRRSGERADGRSTVTLSMKSRSRSPQKTPTGTRTTMATTSSSTPSFVATSPAYSLILITTFPSSLLYYSIILY